MRQFSLYGRPYKNLAGRRMSDNLAEVFQVPGSKFQVPGSGFWVRSQAGSLKTRFAFSVVTLATSSTVTLFTSASFCATSFKYAGSFRLPR